MEIKNCPFCGGEAVLKHGNFSTRQTSYVECEDCFVRTSDKLTSADWCADEEAIKAWNKRADEKARDPENYKKVSYDGLYFCDDGKTPTEMLEERDPDENYIGTKLEALDAYERQLKRWNIKVRYVDVQAIIKAFAKNDETIRLFPEFIRRALNCSVRELSDYIWKMTRTK